MSMHITLDEVKMTASMARLSITEEETRTLQKELNSVLGYISKLQEVNITGIEPTTHAVPITCPFRADKVGEQLSVEQALQNAPKKEASFFAVPTILQKEEE